MYSIGATLVFAAAYERPFGPHASSVSIAKKLLQGSTIDIFACMIANMLMQPLAASLHGGLERNPYIMVCVQESLPAATSKSLVSGVAAGTPGYAAPEQG